MGIDYPIVNVSLRKWNDEIVGEIFRFDNVYHSSDNQFFESYLLNQEFIDCNGRLFKVTGKTPSKNFLAFFLRPNKYTIQFHDTGKQIDLESLRAILTLRVKDLESEKGKKEWIEMLERATTLRELIECRR